MVRQFPLACSTLCLLGCLSPFAAPPLAADDGLDLSPGGYGIFGIELVFGGTDTANACAVQADGRIVFAGTAEDDDGEHEKIALARIGVDGVLDPGFGAGGRFSVDFTAEGYSYDNALARAVVIDDAGRLLVAGSLRDVGTGFRMAFVTRLNANGTIDYGWRYNGITGGWYFSSFLTDITTAAFDPAGNLWLVGPESSALTGGWSFIRLDPNGAEFATETIPIGGYSKSLPNSILFQPDSKPVLGGWVQQNGPPIYAMPMLLRLLAGGPTAILDTNFGPNGNGFLLLDYVAPAWLQSMALLPNGGIVIAGQSGTLLAEDLVVQRLTANGVADGSFEEYVSFNLGGTGGDGTFGFVRMVAQSDGKVVVAARALTGDPGNSSEIGVARLMPNNALDPTFGGLGTGKRVFGLSSPPPGGGDDSIGCLTLDAGRPVIVGSGEYINPDTDFGYRRLTNSLIFADGLEIGSWFFWSTAAF